MSLGMKVLRIQRSNQSCNGKVHNNSENDRFLQQLDRIVWWGSRAKSQKEPYITVPLQSVRSLARCIGLRAMTCPQRSKSRRQDRAQAWRSLTVTSGLCSTHTCQRWWKTTHLSCCEVLVAKSIGAWSPGAPASTRLWVAYQWLVLGKGTPRPTRSSTCTLLSSHRARGTSLLRTLRPLPGLLNKMVDSGIWVNTWSNKLTLTRQSNLNTNVMRRRYERASWSGSSLSSSWPGHVLSYSTMCRSTTPPSKPHLSLSLRSFRGLHMFWVGSCSGT